MRLFPDGSVKADSYIGDNTILLGQGNLGPVLTWTLPVNKSADQELSVTYELEMQAYLSQFGDAHWGFMLSAVLADIPVGQYKGIGHICGTVGSKPPCFQIEEWGLAQDNPLPPNFEYLRKGSQCPAADSTSYKVMGSRKRFAHNLYSRYAVWKLNPEAQYDIVFDTGDVMSNNWHIDRWQETVALFDTGYLQAATAKPYAIRLGNLNAQQRAAVCAVPDMRSR